MCHHRQYQEKKITNLMIIVIVYVIIYQCKFAVFCPSQTHLSSMPRQIRQMHIVNMPK